MYYKWCVGEGQSVQESRYNNLSPQYPSHSRTAAQQEAAELQQEVARLEASLHTKQPANRIDTTPSISTAPVNAQAVNALLKQSKALRMRVQVCRVMIE